MQWKEIEVAAIDEGRSYGQKDKEEASESAVRAARPKHRKVGRGNGCSPQRRRKGTPAPHGKKPKEGRKHGESVQRWWKGKKRILLAAVTIWATWLDNQTWRGERCDHDGSGSGTFDRMKGVGVGEAKVPGPYTEGGAVSSAGAWNMGKDGVGEKKEQTEATQSGSRDNEKERESWEIKEQVEEGQEEGEKSRESRERKERRNRESERKSRVTEEQREEGQGKGEEEQGEGRGAGRWRGSTRNGTSRERRHREEERKSREREEQREDG